MLDKRKLKRWAIRRHQRDERRQLADINAKKCHVAIDPNSLNLKHCCGRRFKTSNLIESWHGDRHFQSVSITGSLAGA